MDLVIVKTVVLLKNSDIFQFQRKLLVEAHKATHGAPSGACTEGGPSASRQGETMLLMVEHLDHGITATVLRSLDELQPGGTVNHSIPYREGCAYTLFQGEPANVCLCSNPFFPSILKLERFTWGPIAITELK